MKNCLRDISHPSVIKKFISQSFPQALTISARTLTLPTTLGCLTRCVLILYVFLLRETAVARSSKQESHHLIYIASKINIRWGFFPSRTHLTTPEYNLHYILREICAGGFVHLQRRPRNELGLRLRQHCHFLMLACVIKKNLRRN